MADSQSVLRMIQEGGMIPFNCLIKRLVAKATASQDTRDDPTGHVHNNNSSFWDSEGRREQREFTRSGRGCTNNPDSIPLLYYSLLCFNNRLISSVGGYLLTTENSFGLGFLAVDATRPLERALNMKCTRLYVLVCTTCLALSKEMKG